MKKSLWLFLLKLIPTTVVLGWIWFAWFQREYVNLIEPLTHLVFGLVGAREWRLFLVAEHFTNLVPYVALVLATPGLFTKWKRTLLGLFGGLALLVIVHVLMSVGVWFADPVMQGGTGKTAYKYIVSIFLVNDAMPLILWLVFFPGVLGEMFKFVKFGRGGGEE